MKRLLLFVLFGAGSCLPAWGNTYRGEFSVTFDSAATRFRDPDSGAWQTSPGIAGISIGDVYSGWFEYDSPAVDGVFTPVDSLRGGIFLPAILFQGTPGPDMTIPFSPTMGLTITGDQVADFSWGLDWGSTSANFGVSTWNLGTGSLGVSGDRYSVNGTVSFDGPTAVPDTGGTLWLLAGAVLCLVGLRAVGVVAGHAARRADRT